MDGRYRLFVLLQCGLASWKKTYHWSVKAPHVCNGDDMNKFRIGLFQSRKRTWTTVSDALPECTNKLTRFGTVGLGSCWSIYENNNNLCLVYSTSADLAEDIERYLKIPIPVFYIEDIDIFSDIDRFSIWSFGHTQFSSFLAQGFKWNVQELRSSTATTGSEAHTQTCAACCK